VRALAANHALHAISARTAPVLDQKGGLHCQ